MNKAEIYSTAGCMYCNKAKKLLTLIGIEYKDIDVTHSFESACQTLEKKYNLPGLSTVPQIIINDKYVGGYDSLEKMYKNGTLNEILE